MYARSPPRWPTRKAAAGSLTHLSMALFLKRAGLDMTNVSYRGNAPALTDVIAGHLPVMFLQRLGCAAASGERARSALLAVSSNKRVPQIPDIPTIAESGFSGLQRHHLETGLVAPAGTPKNRSSTPSSERDCQRGQGCKNFVEHLESYGVDPVGNSPAEFAAIIAGRRRAMGGRGQDGRASRSGSERWIGS